MATLPDMLHAEIQRCRRVAEDCASLGTSGAFASALIQQALRQAERALEGRDLPAIQQSIDRLRGWQDVMPDAPRRDRKSTRLNSSHSQQSRMPSSA